MLENYRYSVLERNIDTIDGRRLDIEAFHACEDNKYIKEEMFNIISTFDKNSVMSYSYIQNGFYKKIEQYLISIDVMTSRREVNHYER